MGAFDNTIGAELIGCFLTAVLFGITCIQVLIFFQNAERESRLNKIMVAGLFTIDTVHMAIIAYEAYTYLVTFFDDVAALSYLEWSIPTCICISTISDTVVRLFFMKRVWHLSGKNRILTGILFFMIVLILLSGMALGIKALSFTRVSQFALVKWLLYSDLIISTIGDLYVGASLCFYLYKGRTGYKGTDTLVNILIKYTVSTGLLTSVFSLLCLITYATMPNNFIFIALYSPDPKLYLNALLASLNARPSLRKAGSTSSPSSPSGQLEMVWQPNAESTVGSVAGEGADTRVLDVESATGTLTTGDMKKMGIGRWDV